MDYNIRRLDANNLDDVISLAWKTFLEFEAPVYSQEGIDTFRRDIVDNERFKEKCRLGINHMWGAFDANKLVGIFVIRNTSHICLAFTHCNYHRQGIASNIFRQLIEDIKRENPEVIQITVNSSPYGKPFYHHLRFVDQNIEQTIDGMRFTPMSYSL